jgi:hypothetical protein
MRRFIIILCAVIVFGIAPVSNGETLNEDLIVVGLPELSNGWWLNEADSREVFQYWGGLDRNSENPPGGLIYRVERDLNGDGVNEVILRWTIVGATWDVYQRNEAGDLEHVGSLGGANTLHAGTNKDGSSWFRNYQFGPDRDALIYEYSVSTDLKIAYAELEYYPAENNQMSVEVENRFANDKKRYLGTAENLQFKKALMLSLLYELADPWEDADGAIAGSAHWGSSEMQSQLRNLEAQGKTQFTLARASLIQRLGERFRPKIPISDIRLMSISKDGELGSVALDDLLVGQRSVEESPATAALEVPGPQAPEVPEASRWPLVLAGVALLGILVLLVRAYLGSGNRS